MYDIIGKKIKRLTVFVVGVVATICIIGMIVFAFISDNFIADGDSTYKLTIIIVAAFVMIAVLAWVLSFFMYGFGELIDKATDIDKKLDEINKKI